VEALIASDSWHHQLDGAAVRGDERTADTGNLADATCVAASAALVPLTALVLADCSAATARLTALDASCSRLRSSLVSSELAALPALLALLASLPRSDAAFQTARIALSTEKLLSYEGKVSRVLQQLQRLAYSPERLIKLRKIRDALNEQRAHLSRRCQALNTELSAYQALGAPFQSLVKEFAAIKAAMEETQWRIKRFQTA
jgi:vacuolar-type H+-ATPase subunit I/STV1